MNNKLLKIGVPALALAGLVGAGFAVRGNLNSAVKVNAEAGDLRDQAGYTAGDTIFLQVKNSWAVADAGLAIYFDGTDVTAKWSPKINVADYKIAGASGEGSTATNAIYAYTLPESFNQVYDKITVVRYDPAGDFPTARDGGWNHTGELTADIKSNAIWLPNEPGTSDGGFYKETGFYTATVGGKTALMRYHSDSQVKLTVSGATKGDLVSVKYGFDADPGTLYPEDKPSNNLRGDFKLKVGGDVTIYLTKEGWSAWASGYEGYSNTDLQDFCDHMIKNTISEGVCHNSNWNVLKAEYNALGGEDAELKATLHGVFTGASIAYDDGWASVISEAKNRYVFLVNNKDGFEDFAALKSMPSYNVAKNTNNSAPFIAAGIIGFALLAGCSIFIFTRKKEN